MFVSQKMAKVEIIVPERDALAVTSRLAEEGVFHQVDASYMSSQPGANGADVWRSRSSTCAALERRVLSLMQALDVAEGVPPADDLASLIDVETVGLTVGRLEQEVHALTDELTDEQNRLEQLQGYIRQLEPISDLDIDLSVLRNPRYVCSMLGTMPAANVGRLRTSLARVSVVLLPLRQDGQQAVVWLLGARRNADILERAARSAYLNPISLPDAYQGTPAQVIQMVQTEIERVQQQLVRHRGEMVELHAVREQQLRTLLWRVRASRMLMDAMARYGRLRYTYLIVGWVPASRVETLSGQLRRISPEILIEATPVERSGDRRVPVALDNPGIVRAFQVLVSAYGWPRYGEIDPTPLLAVTFPLLFGAMFGDVGHGIVLALLGGLLASGRVRALRGMSSMGLVVAICGLAATGFGFLYGSVFGLEDLLPALWLRPMESMMEILMLAVAAGLVLLSTGFAMGILNAWMARDWGQLVVGHNGLAGLVLYWSLIGLGLGAFVDRVPVPAAVFGATAALSGLGVMFSEPLGRLIMRRRPLLQEGVGTYVVQAVFEMFETLIALFSNSLSYVRVGAFAVAHGGLGAVILILAEMVSPGHGLGYWVVFALGNLFVIGFEGLIVGIQTLRLEYYEFFGKFFVGGGTRYEPLKIASGASE